MIPIKNALRSIWRAKRTFAACILLIALGIASYTGFSLTGNQLLLTMEEMYRTGGFGDAFATVEGIPQGKVAALNRLEGIAEAHGSITVDVQVDHDDNQVLNLHLISSDPGQDGMILTSGNAPSLGEVVINDSFFQAQGLELGDTITLVVNGKQVSPVISGTATSPAYISVVGDGLTGDETTSGYAYLPRKQIEALAEKESLINHISFRLEDNVTFSQIEYTLTDALERYGLLSLYGREDHPSHNMTYENFAGLGSTAVMIAFVFLSVSILVLYIILRRVIEQERIQIGTLKAFGYPQHKILFLYMGYGGVVGLAGGILGTAAGLGIAWVFTDMYLEFFPMLPQPLHLDPAILLSGLAVASIAGLVGAAMGVKSVLRLSPAEAMRAPAPPSHKGGGKFTASPLLHKVLSTTGFMAVRGMSRSKFRSGFVAMGMGVSFAILVFMSSYASYTNIIMMDQFNHVQRYDLKLSLQAPAGYTTALQSAYRLENITYAEGVLELPVTVHHGHLQQDITLTGLEQGATLRQIYDSTAQTTLTVPQTGAVVSQMLADKLEAGVGDTITFTTDYTGDELLPVTITAIVRENMGLNVYMELDNMCLLLGVPKSVTGILLSSHDADPVKELMNGRAETPALSDQKELQTAIQASLDATLGVNVGVFCIIGLGVALAIIASTASITLSERSREYATLRVLGMHPREIGQILSFEYYTLTLLGFLPGIPMAFGLRTLITSSMSSETLSIPSYIDPVHFLVAGLICLGAVTLANQFSIRHIAKSDMPQVLKERE